LKKTKRALVMLATLGLLLSLSGVAATGAAGAKGGYKDAAPRADTPNYAGGALLPIAKGDNMKGQPPLGPSKIGDSKIWLGLDDVQGRYVLKSFTLRAVGNHAEVWVANNLNFPTGDCRNDGVRNVITNDQVAYLIDQFDNNMYPIEADWWGTAPERHGNKALLPKFLPNIRGLGVNIPQSYYSGEGDNIVVLVDNVRDTNYYDTNNTNTYSYIAGFYSSGLDDYFDRTVMTIDSWDWIHRTGDDPPHDPSTDPCTSAPARPNLYEGVFAHEYQHLLHHYTDPDELSWVNEGLSDFTEVITGYAHVDRHVDEKGYESHTQAYLGWLQVYEPDWNPITYDSGPENGLTAWGDQGDGEILADYGNAMFFMNFLDSQSGLGMDFFHTWQHEQANGIEGLNNALDAVSAGTDFESLFDDSLVSALVDGYIDNGAAVSGGTAAQFQNDATEATILLNGQANDTTGAPPWGADYIDLGSGAGLSSLVFDGDDEYFFPAGTDWLVDTDGYYTNPDVGGDAADNYGDEQDLSMVYDVTGQDGEVLTFNHYYDLEADWDFGFVQASTDGGHTWQSLACTGVTSVHDSAAMPRIVANLPGYSGTAGSAGSPLAASCPALPAGVTHLAFRLMSDWATNADGWHVKDIKLDGVDVGTPGSITGWDNIQHLNPATLTFGFALVGITGGVVDAYGDVTAGSAIKVVRPTLGAGNTYDASGDLAGLSGYDQVVAIVWGIPADEESTLYQPYSLLVNGAERADGA